jgi:hypothetical protein
VGIKKNGPTHLPSRNNNLKPQKKYDKLVSSAAVGGRGEIADLRPCCTSSEKNEKQQRAR